MRPLQPLPGDAGVRGCSSASLVVESSSLSLAVSRAGTIKGASVPQTRWAAEATHVSCCLVIHRLSSPISGPPTKRLGGAQSCLNWGGSFIYYFLKGRCCF